MGKPATKADTVGQIVTLYSKGMGAVDVAARTGVGCTTVYRVLSRQGVSIRQGFETHRHLRKLTDDQIAEAVRSYTSGVSLSDLAATHGLTMGSVTALLRRRGVKIAPRGNRPRVFTPEEVAEMRGLYDAGLTRQEVAARFGTSPSQVAKWLRLFEGDRHHHWRGGRTMAGGYVLVRVDDDDPLLGASRQNGYIAEHRLVMARHLGRPLRDDETVHHVNGNRTDNRVENLQLRQGRHGKHSVFCCGDCGSVNIVPMPLKE